MNPHSRLGASFLRNHPAAAARVLEDFPAEDVAKFLAAASPSTAQPVFAHLTPGFAASCLLCIEPAIAGTLFAQLTADLQVMLLRTLEQHKREPLLNGLQPDVAATIRRLLPYPDGSAGVLMEAPLASVPEDLLVRDALKRIKRIRHGMKFYVYVTNAMFQLTGVVTLHELIRAQPTDTVRQVMHVQVISLSPAQSIRNVMDSPYWQEYHALPVTDEENVLLGVIRQKHLRRYQERSVQADAVSGGLGMFVTVGELFSITAAHLLAGLIASGAPQKRQDRRG